ILWSMKTSTVVKTISGNDQFLKVRWGNDKIAAIYGQRTVVIVDAHTGQILHTLSDFTDDVWDLAWSPDYSRVATVTADNTVRIVDAATGKTISTFTKKGTYIPS